jgi:hypothetical protein
MRGRGSRKERLIAAFGLGLLLFMPPLLAVASRDVTIGGIPLLYLWLFGGWALLVGVLILVIERTSDEDGPP